MQISNIQPRKESFNPQVEKHCSILNCMKVANNALNLAPSTLQLYLNSSYFWDVHENILMFFSSEGK